MSGFHLKSFLSSGSAIKSFNDTRGSFNNTHELLKNAIFLKQQLKYVESRRPNKKESSSMYKRFSSHIPDLTDLSGVVRETTNRVENIVSGGGSARASTGAAPAPPTELQKSNTSMY